MKVALPATLPQCVGLYDFEVDESKEKDCLPFKKVRHITKVGLGVYEGLDGV